MLNEEINDLLSLLALMIFADKKVVRNEIISFLKHAEQLQVARAIEPRVSEAKLLVWYESHKAELEAVMESPDFETWLYERLDRLNSHKDKAPIIDVLHEIALSDGEIHVSETALLKLTERRWNLAS